jgi:uncharacterized membrane protein
MRNDFTAYDGPQLANAAPTGRGRSRRVVCGLLALSLTLALIAPGATALAAEPTTGYSQTTPAPKTTTTPATTTTTPTTTTPATTTPATTSPSPKGEAAPTQTSSTPTSEKTSTSTNGTEPTATTAAKAKTLPFTGLDLRWVILGGVLLVGMGMSIIVVQRGRHGTGR